MESSGTILSDLSNAVLECEDVKSLHLLLESCPDPTSKQAMRSFRVATLEYLISRIASDRITEDNFKPAVNIIKDKYYRVLLAIID